MHQDGLAALLAEPLTASKRPDDAVKQSAIKRRRPLGHYNSPSAQPVQPKKQEKGQPKEEQPDDTPTDNLVCPLCHEESDMPTPFGEYCPKCPEVAAGEDNRVSAIVIADD